MYNVIIVNSNYSQNNFNLEHELKFQQAPRFDGLCWSVYVRVNDVNVESDLCFPMVCDARDTMEYTMLCGRVLG